MLADLQAALGQAVIVLGLLITGFGVYAVLRLNSFYARIVVTSKVEAMGFVTITIILSLGDTGKTQLVVAGLVIYSIPIIDTVLAIVRRKLARKSISEADDQHLHHMLKRALGVKGAALSLYGIGALFAMVGVAMTISRARITYFLAIVFVSYIIVVAIKIARRQQWEEQASRVKAGAPNGLTGGLRPASRGAKPSSRRPATEAARPPSPPPASG